MEFHAAGAQHRERLLQAGNQVGKTWCGAAEVAMHLTGRYPDWWEGRRFERPIRAWAASVTSQATRDNPQQRLLGPPENDQMWGEAAIPADCIAAKPSRSGPTPFAVEGITVEHVAGGTSWIGFKNYEQGRSKFQGPSLDLVWLDEEPPMDVYMECLTRTNATGGMVFLTFTPLLGQSTVVASFHKQDDSPDESDDSPGQYR